MKILPLDRLLLDKAYAEDAEINGAQGVNRAPIYPGEDILNTDIEVVFKFIDQYKGRPTTQRSYAKAVERLLLWSINVPRKPISSLTSDDIEEYLGFLADPRPYDVWASDKKYPRDSAQWRPFVLARQDSTATGRGAKSKKKSANESKAGLSPSTRLVAAATLGAFFSWMVEYGYLRKNPFKQLSQLRQDIRGEDPEEEDAKVEHYLNEAEWGAFVQAVHQLPRNTAQEVENFERALFMSELMFFLAPRVSELASGKMKSFSVKDGQWWWKVLGKGKKLVKIPLAEGMVKALVRYRTFLGLPPVPHADDDTPLLPSLRASTLTSIGARQINNILDDLFAAAAQLIEARTTEFTKEQIAVMTDKLRQASAHWGRHSSITFQVNSGIDRSLVQKNARHSDARTTNRYIHDDKDHWHQEMQKLKHTKT